MGLASHVHWRNGDMPNDATCSLSDQRDRERVCAPKSLDDEMLRSAAERRTRKGLLRDGIDDFHVAWGLGPYGAT
ncbi:hypothetical protein GCM10007320_65390 [Pseudorhodoferax aquiterrae]|uniref:Uncharacterized protein n=1 Tax=Pseudorhodoferax aquiterrae TaxID=747304 RepID=A0ABQ3GFN1_9BURK|nr:hypothetical protein GCM10007320_65390 [Pseudorhodoferax aquiterrae]